MIIKILLLLTVSCNLWKGSQDKNNFLDDNVNKIMFMNWHFKYDSLKNETFVKLQDLKIVPGELKIDFKSKPFLEVDDIIIEFHDNQMRTLNKLILPNPFIWQGEYFNEGNSLAWTEFKVNEREIPIRTKFIKGMAFIRVLLHKSNIEKKDIELIKINLREYISEHNN